MYSKSFYIEENIWNNSLSFSDREKETWNKSKLFVPSLKKIDNFSEIKLLEQNNERITFQDFWFDGKISTNWGLENFYEMGNPLLTSRQGRGKAPKIYLFDNHNHALYFWYLAKNNWVIKDNSTLYHIDEHADYRDSWEVLEKTDLQSIFNYANFSKINVGNYIIPSEKEWLVWKTVQIRNTLNLEEYLESPLLTSPQGIKKDKDIAILSPLGGKSPEGHRGVILNLDLDFFQRDLDFIDYELKKKVVRDIAAKADIITVATSPFFINQKLALEVFEDLFYK